MLQALYNAAAWLLNALYIPIKWVLDALIYILIAIPYLILQGILTSLLLIIQGIDFSAVVFEYVAGMSHIPPLGIYIMVSIGLPQFLTILSSAYLIRITLNLIPSAVTRV